MKPTRPLKIRNAWEFWLYAMPTAILLLVWGCGKNGSTKSGSSTASVAGKSSSGGSAPKNRGGGLLSSLFGSGQKQNSKNKLKQIGLALHNYHDTFYAFPPGGIYDKTMRGHHSWQTCLLPFVEQNALYNRIDTNEPWNSPQNRPLFKTEVSQYLLSGNTGLATKNSDGLALSHYAGNKNVFFPNSRMRLRNFTDGTTNTMMAGEVSGGLKPWGDPTNYRDLTKGLGTHPEKFGGVHGERTMILMTDGSVRELNNATSPQILKAISTPAGGEKITEF